MTKPVSKSRKTEPPKDTTGRKPTYRLHRVLGDGDAASWTPIGAAWPHKDGKGFSIILDAMPIHGRIAMRLSPLDATDGGQP